jgi:hypothetical protein
MIAGDPFAGDVGVNLNRVRLAVIGSSRDSQVAKWGGLLDKIDGLRINSAAWRCRYMSYVHLDRGQKVGRQVDTSCLKHERALGGCELRASMSIDILIGVIHLTEKLFCTALVVPGFPGVPMNV